MYTPTENYAFIDGTNLHLTYEYLGWRLDYNKLRNHLSKTHGVTKAYYFIGFLQGNQRIYSDLKTWGYSLKFREVSPRDKEYVICHKCGQVYEADTGKYKCDCDADIVLQIMNDINNFNKAVLITSDGDFDHVVEHLIRSNKLKLVLAPCKKGCSYLLKRVARGRITFIDELRAELEKI
jgi:uncharacterized LabA/DUF88 family protein